MADANAQVVEAGADADVLLWLSPTDTNGLAATLEKCPNAKWVQLPWAGIEAFVEAGVLDPSRTWTCGKGVYAEPVAEHALALALAGLRELPMRIRATTWERQGGVSLYDGKATVLGSGGITACLLDLLRPMRTAVTVVRRDTATPLDGAARVVGPDALHESMAEADVVFLALALTPETTGIIDAAARRQKWIDQSQSVNLFLATPEMKTLSHMYGRAWDKGLKTTYYLRTLQASNIEKATIDVKKEVRGGMSATPAKVYTAEEKNACSLDAMLNGGTCEACQ